MSYGILYEEAFKPDFERELSKSAEASVTATGALPPIKVNWLALLAGGAVMGGVIIVIAIATRKRYS